MYFLTQNEGLLLNKLRNTSFELTSFNQTQTYSKPIPMEYLLVIRLNFSNNWFIFPLFFAMFCNYSLEFLHLYIFII